MTQQFGGDGYEWCPSTAIGEDGIRYECQHQEGHQPPHRDGEVEWTDWIPTG